MNDDGPAVREISTAVYVIPTDAPEADGTLTWDQTTMVVAWARAGAARGVGWTYAAAAAQSVITDLLAGAVTGRSAMDVAGSAEAMARAVRNIGRRVDRHLGSGHRAMGPEGTAARRLAPPAARAGTGLRPRLRQRRLHDLRRAADPLAAGWLGGEGPHPAGEDQDRRELGHARR